MFELLIPTGRVSSTPSNTSTILASGVSGARHGVVLHVHVDDGLCAVPGLHGDVRAGGQMVPVTPR